MAVEGVVDVFAEAGEGFEAGVSAQEGAIAGEEEGGGDGADGGRTAEGLDEAGVGGEPDGEVGVERDDFGGDLGDGAVVHDDADEHEAAAGEILLEPVPVGDGTAAGGIVGPEEEDELDLAGVVGGLDFAGEFGGEVFQDEVGDGRGGAEVDGDFLLSTASSRKKN